MSKGKGNAKRRVRILVLGHGATDNIYKAGGEPVTVDPHTKRAVEIANDDTIAGVLLLGGSDVNPEWYGAEPDETVYGIDNARDCVEFDVLEVAERRGLPVMGICRGSQMLNVHAGGTLHLDIDRDANATTPHWGTTHDVIVKVDSVLSKAWGGRRGRVISYHHQAVDEIGDGLVVSAVAPDGIVEAIESTTEWWRIGVQFHPEMARGDAKAQAIFDRFVYAAGAKAGVLPPRESLKGVVTPPKPYDRSKPAPKPRAATKREKAARANTAAAKAAAEKAVGKVVAERATKAKRQRVPSGRNGPVTVTWRCFRGCNIRFDLEDDYYDHMVQLHGEELEIVTR